MITLYLKGISLIAPGMANWQIAKKIFTDKQVYNPAKVDKKLSTLLPANENRRCSRTTKLALSCIQQLFDAYPISSRQYYQQLAYIFTSCNGDLTIFHQIATALAQAGRPVSPIKFHNSVHNAPAGYSAIVLESQSASTSITAYEDSFAAGLLEAAVQASIKQQDCLLCGYDEVPPEPLLSLFPVKDDFAYTLLLSTQPAENKQQQLCRLDISITKEQPISQMENQLFEDLRLCNPQAKILPLLSALATKREQTLFFQSNQQQLLIKISDFL
ncbi:MAG: beta-ketoacyl synthase chain length factor [Pseudomonadota bacterium]